MLLVKQLPGTSLGHNVQVIHMWFSLLMWNKGNKFMFAQHTSFCPWKTANRMCKSSWFDLSLKCKQMLFADNLIDNVQMMQWKEYVREFATLSSQSGHINAKILLIKVCSSLVSISSPSSWPRLRTWSTCGDSKVHRDIDNHHHHNHPNHHHHQLHQLSHHAPYLHHYHHDDPLVVTRRYMETWDPGAGGFSKAKQM